MRLLRLVLSSVAAVLGALAALILLLRVDARAHWTDVVVIVVSGALAGAGTWLLFPKQGPAVARVASGDPADWRRSDPRRYYGARATAGVPVAIDLAIRGLHVAPFELGVVLPVAAVVLAIPFVFRAFARCPACGGQLGRIPPEITCGDCATRLSIHDPPAA
ncbi:MAG: hypothetical protein NVSMB47_06870 [Polyangiales bacterium]